MAVDPLQRAAEQAVVRAALQRGLLTQAQVGAARSSGQPLLQALRPLLDAAAQQALSEVYRQALAAAGAPPATPPGGVPRALASSLASGAGPPGAAAWAGAAQELPRRLGPYEVERELARGGMGAVFVARHVELGRRVALKVMLPEAGDDGARFDREARALAGLRHPGIVVLHEAGEEAGRRWMALELVEGGSLQGRLDRDGPLEPRVAVGLLEPAARAIAFAHARGLLHRDLKPANILLDRDGRPKVTDFGIAKPLDQHTRQLTRTGVAVGTPSFAAPEQCGGKEPDPRSDVYGLGATLYAALSGRAPFEGTLLEILAQVATKDPRPPSGHRPGVPPELDLIVLRCLEKSPADRYPSAEALADELGRWLRGEPLDVQAPTLGQRLRRWRRRHPLALAGLAAAVPLVAVAVVAVRLRGPEAATAAATTVEWLEPKADALLTTASARAQGVVRGPAAWVDVWTDGAPAVRVRGGGDFALTLPLRPGENQVTLRWKDADQRTGELPPRRLVSSPVPDWYLATPAAERPPLPLPPALTFAAEAGHYRCLKDGSLLVWVPPATFLMNERTALLDASAREGEVVRPTTLSRGYFIGIHEVTWARYDAFCDATGRPRAKRLQEEEYFDAPGKAETLRRQLEVPWSAPPDHPVFNVTWDDARAYCSWAGLRLPTEAEWEHAARGPKNKAFPWGNEPPVQFDCNALDKADGFDYTAPPGRFPRDRSDFGCFDMCGNLCEWVEDEFEELTPEPVTDPRGPAGGVRGRLARGANWGHALGGVSLRDRRHLHPESYGSFVGFRVAR